MTRKKEKDSAGIMKLVLLLMILAIVLGVLLYLLYYAKKNIQTETAQKQSEEMSAKATEDGAETLPTKQAETESGTMNEPEPETGSIDYSGILNQGASVTIADGTDFSEFTDERVPYGLDKPVDDYNRPNGCNWYTTKWGQYAVDFIQPLSENVYLTFVETTENGMTETILDTLKEKNAKAIFFLTLTYAEKNPELVRRMIDEGHVIGNNTASGAVKKFLSLSSEERLKEIKDLHDYMLENYQYEMYLFKFPAAEFSERSLAIAQSLGYRSVFWSYTYQDGNVNSQPDAAASLDAALNAVHGGEIMLLHASSATSASILADLIDGIREQGLEIGYYAKMD